ncbi:uncharacterized protein LOC122673856 [Cervus elaphus]|uniref:uncharacterized protein LOC122673856 n=1 Tax=Cervus elaphus TaxID=9860 RepID=UPI001CC2E33B|nr:uncharacterized protein LOC122673856 [Cervus elaphus]
MVAAVAVAGSARARARARVRVLDPVVKAEREAGWVRLAAYERRRERERRGAEARRGEAGRKGCEPKADLSSASRRPNAALGCCATGFVSHVSVRPVSEFSEFLSEESKVRTAGWFSCQRPYLGCRRELSGGLSGERRSRHRGAGASLFRVVRSGKQWGGGSRGEQSPQRTGQFHAGSAARPRGTPSSRAPSEPGWDEGKLSAALRRPPPATLKEKEVRRATRAAEPGLKLSSLVRHQASLPSASLQPGGLLQPEPLFPWQATADPCLHRRHSDTQRRSHSVSCGDFPWILVHTRFCLHPPSISVYSTAEEGATTLPSCWTSLKIRTSLCG